MVNQIYSNAEPVPAASQIAVLPFLAGIDGLLRDDHDVPRLRITIHRVISREGQGYLQQVCGYVTEKGLDWRGKVGRTFVVNEGIMGAAFVKRRIWRTKAFPSIEALRACLREDIRKTGDHRDPETVEVSFLAIPFLGPLHEPVLILYADCDELDFFADNIRVKHVVAMCKGFCRLFDWVQENPFLNVRNFPLQKGEPVTGFPTVYASVQEPLDNIEPPQFNSLLSFNYEAAVA
jgi:hypothetical protein